MLSGCAPAVVNPPRLVSLWPAGTDAVRLEPLTFALIFNRPLRADKSWLTLWGDDDGSELAGESAVSASNAHLLTLRVDRPDAGEFRLHWHVVSARTGVSSDGERPVTFRAESPTPPRLEATPSALNSGDKFELRGSGFQRRGYIRVTVGDDAQEIKTFQADARGGFTEEARMPNAAAFGMQQIDASDADGRTASTAVQVHWGGWPPVVAYTVGQSGSRPGEVTFAVSVRNRSDYSLERVRVSLPDPAGAAFVAAEPPGQRTADTLTWDIGGLDRGVAGPLRVTYRTSVAVAAHARIEFRHRKARDCRDDECLAVFVSDTTSDSTPVGPTNDR